MGKTFIIAEAGVNHNGSVSLAKELVDIAIEAGADAVKFQTFLAEKGISVRAPKANYQLKLTPEDESQFDMIKRLELSYDAHVEIINYCNAKGIKFLSTACDLESVDLLEKFDLPIYKIASCDLINTPLIRYIARLRKKVILSTGMSTLAEVDIAVRELANNGAGEITLLHCTVEYPCPIEEVNLRKMITLEKSFGLPVGFSDHSQGLTASIAAVALGASVIEKHFTINKGMEGPDHKTSLEPQELSLLVKSIRETEKALGDYKFVPTKSELQNLNIMRRKIVAAKKIKKGSVFTSENLSFKRAEGGITPDYYDFIVGKTATKDYAQDDNITL